MAYPCMHLKFYEKLLIRKTNEPVSRTYLSARIQLSYWLRNMLYVNTIFAFDHFVSKISLIILRQSFYYPKVTKIRLGCCLWSLREFELFNRRPFYTFLLVQESHVTKWIKLRIKRHVEAWKSISFQRPRTFCTSGESTNIIGELHARCKALRVCGAP